MSNLAEARQHAWFHHHDADGFITIAKKDKNTGSFRQYHYRSPEQLAEHLSEWIGDDVYFSQNTFYKPSRSIENIRQLRSLYVDLDCYNLGYSPEWVIGKLEYEYFKQTIPEPNIVIYSGKGLVLIWLIDPVPYKALPLWQAIQRHMLNELESLGADPKAVDAARIFRIAGSTNSKNGAHVRTEYRHEYKHDIHQIQYDYLPELKPKKNKPGRKKKIVRLYSIYTLHFSRIRDIHKLIALREGDMEGIRETTCFLYRYWMCCFTEDTEEALQATLELNDEFIKPLSPKEVKRATKSAEKAWEARSNKEADRIAKGKGYPGAGYNISNKTLIDWLQISQEEMKHLSTIINAAEKNRRRRIKYQEEGKQSRDSYLQQESDKTMNRQEQLKAILDQSPGLSNRKIASTMDISESYVRKLKKQIQS